MIAKLTGLIDELGEDFAIIDVGGVGYLVFCSARTLGRLSIGEAASLTIDTHVREDHIHLYGFADTAERDWYRLLTTVQGVGAKVGLGMLSALSGDELVQAIAAGDKTAITRAPGVGPKLATRILSELKDKVAGIALGPVATMDGQTAGDHGLTGEAVSALVNLGYSPSHALTAVSHAAGQLGEGAGLEELIRAGLAELAPSMNTGEHAL